MTHVIDLWPTFDVCFSGQVPCHLQYQTATPLMRRLISLIVTCFQTPCLRQQICISYCSVMPDKFHMFVEYLDFGFNVVIHYKWYIYILSLCTLCDMTWFDTHHWHAIRASYIRFTDVVIVVIITDCLEALCFKELTTRHEFIFRIRVYVNGFMCTMFSNMSNIINYVICAALNLCISQ